MAKRPTTLEGSAEGVMVEPTPFDEFVEHEKKAVQEFGKAFMAVLPEGLREHGESAVSEMIEGYRLLFNATLDEVAKLIERGKFDEKLSDKKTKVPIE
jgi:hypothetical protein